MGGGYRHFFGDRAFWDAKGLFSIRASKLVELAADSPGHARGRLDLYARTGWLDATHVAFFGLGANSPKTRSDFALEHTCPGREVQDGIEIRVSDVKVLDDRVTNNAVQSSSPRSR